MEVRGTGCCPADSLPLYVMEDYEPQGRMERISEVLEAYVVGKGPGAVILFSDIFGIHAGRHKQICDLLASNGYFVCLPDFFGDENPLGKPIAWKDAQATLSKLMELAKSGGFESFSSARSWEKRLRADVMEGVVPWMEARGAKDFAAMGFCWGAYGAFHCAAQAEKFRCCLHYHPSVDGNCKNTEEDDLAIVRAAKCPQLVVSTLSEAEAWKPEGAAHKALLENTEIAERCVWRLQEGQSHGFFSRGDTSKAENKAAVEAAFELARGFLGQHLPAAPSSL